MGHEDHFTKIRRGPSRCWASGRPAGDADSGALPLNADAAVLAGSLTEGQSTTLTLAPRRAAYLVAVDGTITVNGVEATHATASPSPTNARSPSSLGSPRDSVVVEVAA